MSGDDDDFKDPALKHFNRGTFIAKNTVMETAKGALMGALIGAAVMGALALAGPVLMTLGIPYVGPLLLGLGITTGTAGAIIGPAVLAAATGGALWGGGLGAVIKGALSLGSANEAADGEEERLITKGQQNEMRRERATAMEQRRDMQKAALGQQSMMMAGQNPNMSLPQKGMKMGLSGA